MKRFLILFVLCIATSFSAYGKVQPKLFEKKVDNNGTSGTTAQTQNPPSENVTYSFSSGNNGACYVNKATPSTKPSTYWFCGKESAKCDGNAWSSQDTVKKLTSDKNNDTFEHAGKTYYCCYDEKKSDTGTFKIYQAPIVSQEKYELSGTNGGWCYHTISTDVCGKKTITNPCKTLTNCPSGKQIHNNKCLSCPSGQHFKSDTSDDCEPDKQEETPQSSSTGAGDSQQTTTTTTTTTNDSETETTTTVTQVSVGTVMGEVHIGGQNITGKPATVVTYETLFNDSKSCYVRKPSDDSDKTLFWCGKPTTNKCGDYKQSDMVWYEIYDNKDTDDKLCCCGGTETRAGVFQECTTPGTRTKIKKVGGGLCEYTVEVDICNRETVTKDCNTPDPKLSVSGKTPVTKSNMAECGLCTTNEYFKTCALNSCYEKDADKSGCPNKLKQACSIKK